MSVNDSNWYWAVCGANTDDENPKAFASIQAQVLLEDKVRILIFSSHEVRLDIDSAETLLECLQIAIRKAKLLANLLKTGDPA